MNALCSRVFSVRLCLFQKIVTANKDRILATDHYLSTNALCRCFSYSRDEGNFDNETDDFERFEKRSSRTVRRSGHSDAFREHRDYGRRRDDHSFDTNRRLNSDDRKVEPYRVYNYNYFAKGRVEGANRRFNERRDSFDGSDIRYSNRNSNEFRDDYERDDRLEEPNRFGENKSRYPNPKYQRKMQAWKANIPQYSVKIPGLSNVQMNNVRWNERELTANPYNITPENRFNVLNSVITPLHMYSYDHQLNDVYQKMVFLLKQLRREVNEDGADILTDDTGLVCELDFTKGSPEIDEYRNKDEFTIWPGLDGNPKTVGFLVGEPSKHTGVVCVEPDELKITKKSHRLLAKLFQQYLREWSPYGVCTDFSGGGHWRRLVVRSNVKGEHMLIAIMHPQDLNYEKIEEEKDRLRNYFQPLAKQYQIKSLYFQACPGVRCTHEMSPFQLLFGDATIKETLNGLTFQLSPESFFQVNTSAAIVLYNTILDELNLSKNLTVIDLCCGIGAISLHVAPHVQRVIGIDRSKVAIEDAKKNAEINAIRNCTFVAGSVEEIIPELQSHLSDEKVVLIANPGRDGLPMSVISKIRSMEFVEKLVYISCKPEGRAFNNFRCLMTPEFRHNIVGKPFVASHAVPVHLFPSTDHSELIVTFDRVLN